MTDDDTRELETLVLQYITAHRERIPLPDNVKERRLRADRPIKDEYNAVTRAVRAAATVPRHSDALVEGYVDDLLQGALDAPDATALAVRDLCRHLEHPVSTRLYIPLDGVAIAEPELRLGSLRLVCMDDDAFELLIMRPYVNIIRVNPVYDEGAAETAVILHREQLQSLRGRTCVEVTTDVDLTGTLEAAEAVADDVCDFLQVCVAALAPRRSTNPVRWSNGITQASRWSFGISDGPRPRSNRRRNLAYGGPSITIGTSALAKLKEYGLLNLGNALGQPPATEYAALLRRGVRWFAKGERERHADDRKLAYVTAIDLFFSKPGSGATRRFCEGIACVLSDDAAGVASLARTMYGFYASRSETSHEGAFDIETDDGVDELRWKTLNLLSRMVGHTFETKADVEAWVNGRISAMTTLEREILGESTKRAAVEEDDAG